MLQLVSVARTSQLYVKRLARSSPNLEELHFTSCLDTTFSFKNFILPFCQNPHLKKIVILSENIFYKLKQTNISDINNVREAFDIDSILTIYMEKQVILKLNFKIPINSKVTVKPLSELKREIHSFEP